MKKLYIVLLSIGINTVVLANDLSGKYLCNGYDSKDGVTSGF